MSSSKPRPHQHPVLLLFVVGGISCSEVRHIREIIDASRTDVEVSVVGTWRDVGSIQRGGVVSYSLSGVVSQCPSDLTHTPAVYVYTVFPRLDHTQSNVF